MLPAKFDIIYRQSAKPLIKMPLQVRSVGHYIVIPGWKDKVKKKNYLLLYWIVSGSGIFYLNNHPHTIAPGEAFLYLPGDVTRIVCGTSGNWEYRFVTMDGDGLHEIIRQFGLQSGPLASGNCPEYIFDDIKDNLRVGDTRSTYAAGSAAYNLLSMALAGSSKKSTLFDRFKLLVERNFHEKEFNIEYASSELKIHRSTLIKAVRESSGLTPHAYLTRFRLHYCRNLMTNAELSIKEIARRAGFTDQNYFSQVFKKQFGITPSEATKKSDRT